MEAIFILQLSSFIPIYFEQKMLLLLLLPIRFYFLQNISEAKIIILAACVTLIQFTSKILQSPPYCPIHVML